MNLPAGYDVSLIGENHLGEYLYATTLDYSDAIYLAFMTLFHYPFENYFNKPTTELRFELHLTQLNEDEEGYKLWFADNPDKGANWI